jgi:hypothetical protein
MFTTEIKINGTLIGVLHVHNMGGKMVGKMVDKEYLYEYKYEYFEPSVGITYQNTRTQHLTGKVTCARDKGIRHVIRKIFEDIDSQP